MPGSAGVITPCVLYAIWLCQPITLYVEGSTPSPPGDSSVEERYTDNVETAVHRCPKNGAPGESQAYSPADV